VGPGIADALIATAVGLAAAIPAVVAYNHFLNRLRRIVGGWEGFMGELVQLFETYAPHEAPVPRGMGRNRMPMRRWGRVRISWPWELVGSHVLLWRRSM